MSEADSFFDTNVLLYLLSKDAAKADLAEALLAIGGVVSVQVLNEFASVATRNDSENSRNSVNDPGDLCRQIIRH